MGIYVKISVGVRKREIPFLPLCVYPIVIVITFTKKNHVFSTSKLLAAFPFIIFTLVVLNYVVCNCVVSNYTKVNKLKKWHLFLCQKTCIFGICPPVASYLFKFL